MKLLALAVAVSAVALAPSCLPADDTSSSSSSGSSGSTADGGEAGGTTRAGQACLDFASAYANAASRCGDDYNAARQNFITQLAGGDCNSVSIRNESELRNQCLPTFSSISCTNLTQGRFAPACAEQVVRAQ